MDCSRSVSSSTRAPPRRASRTAVRPGPELDRVQPANGGGGDRLVVDDVAGLREGGAGGRPVIAVELHLGEGGERRDVCDGFAVGAGEAGGAPQRRGARQIAVPVGELPFDGPQARDPGRDGVPPPLLGVPDNRCDLGQQPSELVRPAGLAEHHRLDAGGLKTEQRWQPDGPRTVPHPVQDPHRLVRPAGEAEHRAEHRPRHDVAGHGRVTLQAASLRRSQHRCLHVGGSDAVLDAPQRRHGPAQRVPAFQGRGRRRSTCRRRPATAPSIANCPLRPAAHARDTHSPASRSTAAAGSCRPSCRSTASSPRSRKAGTCERSSSAAPSSSPAAIRCATAAAT